MRRTRKWSYVAQEATRLADLGLSPHEIGQRLSVNRSTVQRWMAAGKLHDTRRSSESPTPPGPQGGSHSPVEWAQAVRAAYALDATDEQLVLLAEAALAVARDPETQARVRLTAAGRFQAIVKQLALVARNTAEESAPAPDPTPDVKPSTPPAPRVRRFDPRRQLMAVK